MNGSQYEEKKKQKQAEENRKQAPMDCVIGIAAVTAAVCVAGMAA